MKYAIAVAYFSVFSVFLHAFKPISPKAFVLGAISLLVLCCFAAMNDATGLIDEKAASFVAYDIYTGQDFQIGFMMQYLLAYVPFALLDYEYAAHGMNMGLQAFAFLLGVQYIFYNRFDWKMLVFLVFPSYYHYAIFGLRDPLINLISIFVVIGALRLSTRGFVILCVVLAVAGIAVRAEFSMIILGFAAVRVFFEASPKQKVLIALAGFVSLYGMLLIMPYAFGFGSTGSVVGNIDAMSQFNESRALRHVGSDYGAGSQILGGGLYSYNFAIRYPIQIAASFVTPLPFDVRGSLDMAAFAESFVFCLIFGVALMRHRRRPDATLLFWCGIAYMLLQALFAANYGNILRVRYPCLVFFLASIVTSERAVLARHPSRRSRVRRSSQVRAYTTRAHDGDGLKLDAMAPHFEKSTSSL